MSISYVTPLGEGAQELVGNKFFKLSQINSLVHVPAAFALNNTSFEDSLDRKSKQDIQGYLTMLKSNGGYQLNKMQQSIMQALDGIQFNDDLRTQLITEAERLSKGWKIPLIVRSSSCFEDGEAASGAGIYESVSGIQDPIGLEEAIVHCWKASFSLAALAHRLRINEFQISPLPGLIIQQYIRPSLSGVCFSTDPVNNTGGIFIEYTKDGSDGIESGTGTSQSITAIKNEQTHEYLLSRHDLENTLIQQLLETAELFKNTFNMEMEYEWAYAGTTFYVLQTRPITTQHTQSHANTSQAVLKVFDLYQQSNLIDEENIGSIKPIYGHSISKRKPIRIFAIENDISINGSAVVIANQRGVSQMDIEQIPSLSRLKTPILTIDLGPHLRSFYAQRGELNNVIHTLIRSSNKPIPMIIREFASGQFSAVSMQRGDAYLVEVCRGSLIGINRGFVETESYYIDLSNSTVTRASGSLISNRYYGFDENTKSFSFQELAEDSMTEVNHEALLKIASFNKAVNEHFENNILEWTIIDGDPIYIDNTPNTEDSSPTVNSQTSTVFISPGKLAGRVLRIDDLQKLEYISSGPTLNISGHLPTLESNVEIRELMEQTDSSSDLIIVSKFPYTALSVLVGKVRGFIVESGPVLCHLAIIARENNTPVAVIPYALSVFANGDDVCIE
ncbi:hypothetical protein HGA91_00465 [candidate division WWE3 bacterium]|nr:hypothetical protein [candidate division WWE3 bacterium]